MIPASQSALAEEPPLERSSAKRTYPVYKTVLAIVLWLFAGALIALLIHEWQDLPEFAVWQAQANFSRQLWLYAGEVLLAIVAIITGLWLLPRRRQQTDTTLPGGQKLSPRTKAAAILVILLIPLTIFIGEYYLGARKYFFISLLIILEAMLPFALIFEGRRPQARELVTIAVLCAIAVAGRAAFFMLPQFKPMLALVIIAAVPSAERLVSSSAQSLSLSPISSSAGAMDSLADVCDGADWLHRWSALPQGVDQPQALAASHFWRAGDLFHLWWHHESCLGTDVPIRTDIGDVHYLLCTRDADGSGPCCFHPFLSAGYLPPLPRKAGSAQK